MFGWFNDAFKWWFISPGQFRAGRFLAGLVLWGWFAYEVVMGVTRWMRMVQSSFWWLPCFPLVIPLVSLQAVPSVLLILLVPVALEGPESRWTRWGTIAALGILAASLNAAMPVIQHYVHLFFLIWF